MAKAPTTDGQQAFVCTTQHRGVFFGYGEHTDAKTVRLERVRMCVYWSVGVKGILGLAVTGPKADCRVTGAVPALTIQDVTSLIECTPEAVAAWEKAPWH